MDHPEHVIKRAIQNASLEAAVKTQQDVMTRVVEVIEKHLDANGEHRAAYKALRRLRTDII